jgi:hypothetical protein
MEKQEIIDGLFEIYPTLTNEDAKDIVKNAILELSKEKTKPYVPFNSNNLRG